jgi:membrane-associated phospholipid phosphatase
VSVATPPVRKLNEVSEPWRRQRGAVIADWLALLARPPRATWPPHWRSSPFLLGSAAVIIVLIIASMALVDAWSITEARTFPLAFLARFEEITDYGLSGWFLWPLGIGLVLAALVPPPPLRRFTQLVYAAVMVRVSFLFLAIGIPGLFVATVKQIIGRGRPYVSDTIPAPFLYHPLSWGSAFAGFPSGHATTAFSVLIAFGALWPALRPVLWIYVLLIGASRVIVNAHYPSDVIAGAVVGTVGALLVRDWFAARGLAFVVEPNGHVRPLPGPFIWRVVRLLRQFITRSNTQSTSS